MGIKMKQQKHLINTDHTLDRIAAISVQSNAIHVSTLPSTMPHKKQKKHETTYSYLLYLVFISIFKIYKYEKREKKYVV